MNRTLLRVGRRAAIVLTGMGLVLTMTAGPASAATNLCVSVNGTVLVHMGTATCSSVAGAGNVAIARGANSTAAAGFSAGDTHNRALATTDGSSAFARLGNGNTAIASGTDSGSTAEGTKQTAVASGDGGSAVARFGSNSKAIASGKDSFANANGGNHNIATASGDNSTALAVTGKNNKAIASAFNSSATADNGDNNTAIASSPNCTALATGGGARDRC